VLPWASVISFGPSFDTTWTQLLVVPRSIPQALIALSVSAAK
jgi:hypothetical protein